ncbi:MAG: hypothetical protein R6U20_11550 [Longimonas sp.]|uniref:hypothetical protein n=1 Tax=Longimonas sp. TaxID=2039626 RepID=UPI003975432D
MLRALSIVTGGCALLAAVWALGTPAQPNAADTADATPARQAAASLELLPNARTPDFTQRPRSQSASERTFRSGSWTEVGAQRPSLTNPRALRVARGDVFFRDQSEHRVYRYTLDGEHVRTYGEGRGVGPGQHMAVMGYGIASNGQVVMGDAQGRKISVFNEDGTVERSERPDFGLMRLGVTSEDQIVTLAAPTAVRFQSLLGRGHREGEDLVRNPRESIGLLEGGLRGDTQGGAIQFSFFYGYLIRWHSNGTIDYIRRMIGDYPPTPTEPAGGATKRVVGNELQFRINDVSIHDDEIHVLVIFLEPDENRYVVDVYDLPAGDYRYSYEPPEPVRSLAVTGDHVIGGQDTTFAVWDRSAIEE